MFQWLKFYSHSLRVRLTLHHSPNLQQEGTIMCLAHILRSNSQFGNFNVLHFVSNRCWVFLVAVCWRINRKMQSFCDRRKRKFRLVPHGVTWSAATISRHLPQSFESVAFGGTKFFCKLFTLG